MTLKEKLVSLNNDFMNSRMEYIKQELESTVKKGLSECIIDAKYYDDDIIEKLRNEGLNVEECRPEKIIQFIKISGWQ